MTASRTLTGLALLLAGVVGGPGPAIAADALAGGREAVEEHWDFLNQYCVECHNFEDWAGGVAFDTLLPENVPEDAETWEAVVRKLRGHLMPPPGKPKPENGESAAFVAAMETYLDTAAAEHPDPGYVTLHRLNRAEYENEIREILALDIDAGDLLPKDTQSEGFSNISEVLQVSPTFFHQYISAARKVSLQAVGDPAPAPGAAAYKALEGKDHTAHVEGLPLGTRGGMLVEHYFPADGEYRFNIDIASPDGYYLRSHWLEYENTLIVTIDGKRVFEQVVGGPADLERVDRELSPAANEILARFQEIPIRVSAGRHRIGITWVAKTFAESDVELELSHPGMGVESIPQVKSFAFAGPYDTTGIGLTASREQIFSCYPEAAFEETACARSILARLAERAYRRPLEDTDIEQLMRFYENGHAEKGFESGVQKAIMAMLSSPKFLYRAELPPQDVAAGDVFPVSDLELASRLSFFLWGRGPDDALLDLASKGELRQPEVLRSEVERMLADPRAETLAEQFAFQWLKIAVMDSVEPDTRIFPNFDPELRAAFKQELALFMDSILRADRSVMDLLTASHTYVNERLATHYGLEGVRGGQFRRVELPDSRRRGLLGKGAVLMASSYPDRTSPVLRGAWILENIMGTPPGAPPPDVEAFPEAMAGEAVLTVRERLETHRAVPSCNSCHGVMDPLGIALENFNAIGEWRNIDRYAATGIDASGKLADGRAVTGPDDLRQALADDPDQFVQTLTERLFTYALGRAAEYHDMPVVRDIVRQAAEENYRFSAIVTALVSSAPFQMKRMPEAQNGVQEAKLND